MVTFTPIPLKIYVFLIAAYVFSDLKATCIVQTMEIVGLKVPRGSNMLLLPLYLPDSTCSQQFPNNGPKNGEHRTETHKGRTCAFASSLTCSVFCKASSVSSRAACFKRDSPSASTRLQGKQGSGFIHFLSMPVTRDRLQSLYLVIQPVNTNF